MIDYLRENPNAAGIHRGKIEAMLAKQLAQTDPANALEWANGHLYGRPHAEAIDEIVKVSAGSQPSVAAQIASELPPGESRANGLKAVAQKWFSSDPENATTWASALGTTIDQRSVLEGLQASSLSREQRLQIEESLRPQEQP